MSAADWLRTKASERLRPGVVYWVRKAGSTVTGVPRAGSATPLRRHRHLDGGRARLLRREPDCDRGGRPNADSRERGVVGEAVPEQTDDRSLLVEELDSLCALGGGHALGHGELVHVRGRRLHVGEDHALLEPAGGGRQDEVDAAGQRLGVDGGAALHPRGRGSGLGMAENDRAGRGVDGGRTGFLARPQPGGTGCRLGLEGSSGARDQVEIEVAPFAGGGITFPGRLGGDLRGETAVLVSPLTPGGGGLLVEGLGLRRVERRRAGADGFAGRVEDGALGEVADWDVEFPVGGGIGRQAREILGRYCLGLRGLSHRGHRRPGGNEAGGDAGRDECMEHYLATPPGVAPRVQSSMSVGHVAAPLGRVRRHARIRAAPRRHCRPAEGPTE